MNSLPTGAAAGAADQQVRAAEAADDLGGGGEEREDALGGSRRRRAGAALRRAEVEPHLKLGAPVAALLVEGRVLVRAVEDHLVAACFARELSEPSQQRAADPAPARLFVRDDVLDVAGARRAAEELGLDDERAAGDHPPVALGDADAAVAAGVAHARPRRVEALAGAGALARLLSGVVTVATGTTADMLGSHSFVLGWLDPFACTVLVPTALDECFVMQEWWCASRLTYCAFVDEHIYRVRMLCASIRIFFSSLFTGLGTARGSLVLYC